MLEQPPSKTITHDNSSNSPIGVFLGVSFLIWGKKIEDDELVFPREREEFEGLLWAFSSITHEKSDRRDTFNEKIKIFFVGICFFSLKFRDYFTI